eukprot:7351521-Alexandrium_andersonii.AAC.1
MRPEAAGQVQFSYDMENADPRILLRLGAVSGSASAWCAPSSANAPVWRARMRARTGYSRASTPRWAYPCRAGSARGISALPMTAKPPAVTAAAPFLSARSCAGATGPGRNVLLACLNSRFFCAALASVRRTSCRRRRSHGHSEALACSSDAMLRMITAREPASARQAPRRLQQPGPGLAASPSVSALSAPPTAQRRRTASAAS